MKVDQRAPFTRAVEAFDLRRGRQAAREEIRRKLKAAQFLALLSWIASCTFQLHEAWGSVLGPAAVGLWFAVRVLWLTKKWGL